MRTNTVLSVTHEREVFKMKKVTLKEILFLIFILITSVILIGIGIYLISQVGARDLFTVVFQS